jgi:predicted HTH transcriptional regulator
MNPDYLYSKQDISENISLNYTQETLFIEFKKEINLMNRHLKTALAEEFACDICQFANTLGGVILIGVEEGNGNIPGLSVATRFVNVDNIEQIRVFLNDKVRNFYYPSSINFDIVAIEVENDISLLAINIYPLTNNIACMFSPSSSDYLRYPFRTEFGKKYMRPYEVEERMNNRNRSLYLQLSNIWQKDKEVQILSQVIKEEKSATLQWDNRDLNIFISELFDHEFRLKVNDQLINIPYGLLQEVWTTYDGKIGIIINARIVISSDRKKISLSIQ